MSKPKHTWCFSLNGEDDWFGTVDREEALDEGESRARDEGLDSFFIAPAIVVEPESVVDVDGDMLLEWIDERCIDEQPEDWEWFAKVPPADVRELESRVNAVVVAWMKEKGHEPKWFEVGKVEEISLLPAAARAP